LRSRVRSGRPATGSRNPDVVGRFLLTALLAFALVGLGVGQLIVSEIRSGALDSAESHAVFVDRAILGHDLTAQALASPLGGRLKRHMDHLVRTQVLQMGVVRVKVFNSAGVVLYSDEHRLIGRRFPSEVQDLKTVLGGQVRTSVSDLEDPENVYERPFKSLFSTYAPLIPKGSSVPVAVAEVYQLKGPIDDRVSHAELTTFTIIVVGLTLLYIFLWPLLRRQTKVLLEKNATLASRSEQLETASVQTIQMLNRIANAKDPYTGGHIGRVAALARSVGESLRLNQSELKALDLAAEFHDIGKVMVPDSILNKPGPLDVREWQEIRKHPATGVEILEGHELFRGALSGVLHHHERFNGTGYPMGLAGEEIPTIARIITVVDAFDAMTTDRPYRQALSRLEAWTRILAGTGSQFCPETVTALARLLGLPEPDRELIERETSSPFVQMGAR
jgi:hypothetical protein